MKMKPNSPDTSGAPPKLVVHNESRTISKLKPKIRIIHIVEPEIIKTDAENFRELVQKLTGKPAETKGSTYKGNNASPHVLAPESCRSKSTKNTESESESAGTPILLSAQAMKIENQELYDEVENPDAFLSFLGDVDGAIHGIDHEFPVLSFRSPQINAFGEYRLVENFSDIMTKR